ncbi:MAG: DNA double-strand break repair nuclease NurA [Nitrososphaerota archaeon]
MLNNLNTMNKPIEEVFMDYISGQALDLVNPEPILQPQDPGLVAVEESDGLAFLVDVLDGPVIRLEPGEGSELVAVDASVVRVAESRLGAIVALRAAVIHRSDRFRVWVLGPFLRQVRPFNSTPSSLVHEIRDELKLFERLVQLWAVSNVISPIYLFDGPLVARADQQGYLLERIVEAAEAAGATVLGFSKESLLMPDGAVEEKVMKGVAPPFIRDLTESAHLLWSGLRCLGDVYLTKLSQSPFYFRVDSYPPRSGVEALSALMSSDALVGGYPETLVLAHSYATFSWLDIVAVKKTLNNLVGASASHIYDPRCSILSPFETRRHENTA